MKPIYRTELGIQYLGDSRSLEKSTLFDQIEGKVDLLFTSPPFALSRKKEYGNLRGEEYVDWFSEFAPAFVKTLKPNGSMVIEMGNTWVKGKPLMSLHPLKALINFLERGELVLCQHFIWNNPARLPSPAQWVNIERIRVKDSFTNIWWMAKNPYPKANNRNVLKEYSQSMLDLLERGSYNSGERPSQHQIGETSFLSDNNGAIPSNVFTISNTKSQTNYLKYCKENKLKRHPARMPIEIVDFFIKFLTDPGDLVFDPFSGSNTTGASAESLDRRWISLDLDEEYIIGSRGRFPEFEDLMSSSGN